MDLSAHIFREYDIRGIVGQELGPDVTRQVGRAYASILRETVGDEVTVVVGRDNRPHSPGLSAGLVEGLRGAGADVLELGTVPTPLVFWAEHRFRARRRSRSAPACSIREGSSRSARKGAS